MFSWKRGLTGAPLPAAKGLRSPLKRKTYEVRFRRFRALCDRAGLEAPITNLGKGKLDMLHDSRHFVAPAPKASV